ncbi:DsbA family oxidoreductase [Gimesia aquarii]|uniref:DSBA-like thioredoxin domain protein n=1 Tax=Gimesia aquarii TaxID=2527964 RepID=A0A517X3N7_9PLAN|nr:DsbA family oxidoreductase [Gimesia aquarii]QDU12105.1 DSBA-like thioredoxin domain protein [Gimesia aquarii]
MTLTVNVISDIICPWCYIGKRRLEKAIEHLGDASVVKVDWHPFQLNPLLPIEGINRREYRSNKFGSWERSLALDAQVTAAGAEVGIDFSFAKIKITPNTFAAHRLVWQAGLEGVQEAVVEAIFHSYFVEARDISDYQTLLEVVAGGGLNRDRAANLLASNEGIDALQLAEQTARQAGVRSVPFSVVNDEISFSGAEHSDVFLSAFEQLISNEHDSCEIKSDGKKTC